MNRIAWIPCVIALIILVGWDFAVATTFLGDDYIFRAFAQLESNPFLAFIVDKHGGEYYRPIPMLLWWILERLSGGGIWLYALTAFGMHLLCAVFLALLGHVLGLSRRTAALAGFLLFIAPAEREAALWFSASTDLLATAAMFASITCFLMRWRWGWGLSLLFSGVAFFCKETALVLPALLLAASWFRSRSRGERLSLPRTLLSVLPHLFVATLYVIVRFKVLHGIGGTNDPIAPWWGRGIQMLSGVVHSVTAYSPLPEWLAWAIGIVLLVVTTAVAWRRNSLAGFALVWIFITLLPLPAAGWVVGARYFYVPAAGMLLLMAIALEIASGMMVGFALLFFLGLGLLCGHHRASEVGQYRQVVAAADAAVTEGLAHGHRIFFVRGAVKDLDLALKLFPGRQRHHNGFVVIPDVPASFIWLPYDLAERLNFVLARPSLPPSGAYRFGGEKIVGQARREESPPLDEVLIRLPELRIINLQSKGSYFTWEDQTQEYARSQE
jgi:hypothetical protein